MKETVIMIGTIVSALILIAIPILCGLSYGLNWYDSIKFLLTVVTFFEAILLWCKIWNEVG